MGNKNNDKSKTTLRHSCQDDYGLILHIIEYRIREKSQLTKPECDFILHYLDPIKQKQEKKYNVLQEIRTLEVIDLLEKNIFITPKYLYFD
jgi:hypothetical protein